MNNFLACPMQYLHILIMKKIFIGSQKSKFNWILYILSGDCIAESLDFFFKSYNAFIWLICKVGKRQRIQGEGYVNVPCQSPQSSKGFLFHKHIQNL